MKHAIEKWSNQVYRYCQLVQTCALVSQLEIGIKIFIMYNYHANEWTDLFLSSWLDTQCLYQCQKQLSLKGLIITERSNYSHCLHHFSVHKNDHLMKLGVMLMSMNAHIGFRDIQLIPRNINGWLKPLLFYDTLIVMLFSDKI